MITYDVFAQGIGTMSQHKTLAEAVAKARKYNHPCTIFRSNNPFEVVKWIFPKRHG